MPDAYYGAVLSYCHAQLMTAGSHLDVQTGINFTTWSSVPTKTGQDKFTFGIVLPRDAATKDANEFIGLLVSTTAISAGSKHSAEEWCSAAEMPDRKRRGHGMVRSFRLRHHGELTSSCRVSIPRPDSFLIPLHHRLLATRSLYRQCYRHADQLIGQRNLVRGAFPMPALLCVGSQR